MPYTVLLPAALRKAGWKAKVFDEEGPEEPHVSIILKKDVVRRVSLRNAEFLCPPGGSWNDVPAAIKEAIEKEQDALRAYWNEQNPHNPV